MKETRIALVRSGKDFGERLRRGAVAGIACGAAFGLVRGIFFRDTLSYVFSGIRSLSTSDYTLIRLYLLFFYLLCGLVIGCAVGGLYSLWDDWRGGYPVRRAGFWLFMLWAWVLVRLGVWLNLVKFLGTWGRKTIIAGHVVREGFVSPRVWAANIALLLFAAAGFVVSRAFFAAAIRRKGKMTPSLRALLFSFVASAAGYFSCAVQVNGRLPYVLSALSLAWNAALLAGFIVAGWVIFLLSRELIIRKGETGLMRALATSKKAVALRWSAAAVSLAGLLYLLFVEDNLDVKFTLYGKADAGMARLASAADSLLDFDGDGYSAVSLVKDPYPFDGGRSIMAVDRPFNGVDEDGVGGDSRDADGDGFDMESDCDDSDAAVYPGAPETLNGLDDDCDGIVDNAPAADKMALFRRARELAARGRLLVLIVCADTARADHVGFLGYGGGTTPTLDEIAKRSFVFSRAYSNGAGTNSTVPSLLFSVPPSLHRLSYFGRRGPVGGGEFDSLQGTLARAGFHNFFLAAPLFIHHEEIKRALEPGFDVWWDSDSFGAGSVPAPRMREEFCRALAGQPAGNGFYYIHFLEPHLSPHPLPAFISERFNDVPGKLTFFSPTEDDIRFMRVGYDRRMAFLDHELGNLVGCLERDGKWNDTLFIFLADHGEEYGEHGGLFHKSTLFEEQVHVPLLVRFPGQSEGGTIDRPVQLMDIAPTVLQTAGIGVPPRMEGRSLLPLMAGENGAPLHEYIFLENVWSRRLYKLAVIWRDYKYIFDFYTGEDFLFDLKRDPRERRDLARTMPSLRVKLKKVLFDHKSAVAMRYRAFHER